ncbi:MAG: TIGR02757 family protein, partial [Ignavibacteria bacterium]|nr:TIGR02757 family protein [Ignavibacteria bacterium]
VNILPSLKIFTSELNKVERKNTNYKYLIPLTENNSACKRLNLYLRWMVRKDEIDTGIWKDKIDKSKLIMPVDTHIYRVSQKLKLIKRKSCDMKFAVELTERLKSFDAADPVKYDFALCHFGIDKVVL